MTEEVEPVAHELFCTCGRWLDLVYERCPCGRYISQEFEKQKDLLTTNNESIEDY